jgi:hypothetical protein
MKPLSFRMGAPTDHRLVRPTIQRFLSQPCGVGPLVDSASSCTNRSQQEHSADSPTALAYSVTRWKMSAAPHQYVTP